MKKREQIPYNAHQAYGVIGMLDLKKGALI